MVFVDVIAGAGFDVANQIGQSFVRLQPDQGVRVIRHAMNRDQLLSLARD